MEKAPFRRAGAGAVEAQRADRWVCPPQPAGRLQVRIEPPSVLLMGSTNGGACTPAAVDDCILKTHQLWLQRLNDSCPF